MSDHNSDPLALDLYCLNCGYNLRGLAGDPRRCPECGHGNNVEDLEVPAALIRKALKKLESGAAMCGASASMLLLWVLPLLYMMVHPQLTPPPLYVWVSVAVMATGAILAYVVGALLFRRSCGHQSCWLSALLKFTILACLIAAFGLTAIVLIVSCSAVVAAARPAFPGMQVLARLGIAVALLVVSGWLYRVAKRTIHPLQRLTAARFARRHLCGND